MGVGMVLVTRKNDADAALSSLQADGIAAYILGEVVAAAGTDAAVEIV
jgi:phosphoribosylaminoimidazole (AIR) synthetase